MKCFYCGTEPNNATTKKELKVCCCYRLHKIGNKYEQHYSCKADEEKAKAVSKMPNKLTDTEIKKAFKVLESWLWCNYHNATDTDKERAELYKAVQTIFNAKKIPEMFTLAKAEAYKEFANNIERAFSKTESQMPNSEVIKQTVQICRNAIRIALNELVGDDYGKDL